jgi:hypothetical protein
VSRTFLSHPTLVAFIAAAIGGCANQPPFPAVTHAPSTQDVTLTTEAGQHRTVNITVPYDSDCSQFPRYTKSYIQNFQGGYILEWNTQVSLLEHQAIDAAKKKAYRSSSLQSPSSELVDTSQMGMLESTCMTGALSAQSVGGTQAHNDLISNPPVP